MSRSIPISMLKAASRMNKGYTGYRNRSSCSVNYLFGVMKITTIGGKSIPCEA